MVGPFWTTSTTKVLVIEDDAKVRRFLRAGFELRGYEVLEAENGTVGLRAAMIDDPDLIILDPLLADIDGSEMLERIRPWSNVPIIALSIKSEEREKVRLLHLGADDYVVRPFSVSELLARSEAVLRRYLKSQKLRPVVKTGKLSVDLFTRAVSEAGRPVKLTQKEYALLRILATHVGLVVTHAQLMKEIWGAAADNIQYLRILVRKLRQKIEADPTRPSLIVSESGVGYRLHRDEDHSAAGKSIIPPVENVSTRKSHW
jgi:two-component system KDP operon response regulator KdpE